MWLLHVKMLVVVVVDGREAEEHFIRASVGIVVTVICFLRQVLKQIIFLGVSDNLLQTPFFDTRSAHNVVVDVGNKNRFLIFVEAEFRVFVAELTIDATF